MRVSELRVVALQASSVIESRADSEWGANSSGVAMSWAIQLVDHDAQAVNNCHLSRILGLILQLRCTCAE